MAQLKLISDLITETRQRADMQNTQFVTDVEITTYLDKAYRKVYNHIVAKYSAIFVSEASIPTVNGVDTYDLPSDFYRLLGVDIVSGSRSYTLRPWSLNERNRTAFGFLTQPFRYYLKGQKIVLKPEPRAPDTLRIIYVPAPPALTGATQINCFDGFDEYIVIDAAIQCKQKEESDVSILMAQKQECLDQIINVYGIGQDDGFPQSVTDVSRVNEHPYFYFWGV
jgi:hypothetical protein